MRLTHEHHHQSDKALAQLQNLTTDETGIFGSTGRRLAMNNIERNRYIAYRPSHGQIDIDIAFPERGNVQEAWHKAVGVRQQIMNDLPLVKIDPSLYQVREDQILLWRPRNPTNFPASFFSIDEVEVNQGIVARPFSMETQLLIMSIFPNNMRTKDLPEWIKLMGFFSRNKEYLVKPAAKYAVKFLNERYIHNPHVLVGKVIANVLKDCYHRAISEETREKHLHLGTRMGRPAPRKVRPYSKPKHI